MKKVLLKISLLVMFMFFTECRSQKNSEPLTLIQLVDLVNFAIKESQKSTFKSDLIYDKVIDIDCENFWNLNFSGDCVSSSSGNKTYFLKNNPIRTIYPIEDIQVEFDITRINDFYIMFASQFKSSDENLEFGLDIHGFFLLSANYNEKYFFATLNELDKSQGFNLQDIYKIQLLDENLFPTSSINFNLGMLKYSSDISIEGDVVEEYLYIHDTNNPDSECIKYISLGNLDLKRISHMFRQKYHCPVSLELTGKPTVSNGKIPLWCFNGYRYN